MKIAVAGTINKDLILPFQRGSIQSIGGIYYSITALSHLTSPETEIIPVSYMGNDLHPAFLNLSERFPKITPEFLVPINQTNHKVILEYSSKEERREKALFNFPPLDYEHLSRIEPDFWILNMITGWDVSLLAYQKLSQSYFSKMYLDVHFLVMGVDDLGRRYPHCPENIGEWLKGSKFVQMNKREMEIIQGEKNNILAFYNKNFTSEQVFILTEGGDGAQIVYTSKGQIRIKKYPAVPLEEVNEVTGCGDVFGAAFVADYLSNQKLSSAMEFANLAGAANTLLDGTNDMHLLPYHMQELKTRD